MRSYHFDAVIFDMDGVITKTARVHAQSWKLVFDEYLGLREKKDKEPFREFTYEDYLKYVDGKPRVKGVRSFLESRNIKIALGKASDTADGETVYGLGNKKNIKFRELLTTKGIKIYAPAINFIKKLKESGLKVGIVSSSKNCKYIIQSANIESLFDTRVDGVVADKLKLSGKPGGDIFVTAALKLKTTPDKSVVIEDAISGVQAGRNGGFQFVIGVARSGNEAELNTNGADCVVNDLADMELEWINSWFCRNPLDLFEVWDNPQQIENIYNDLKSKKKKTIINPNYLLSPKAVLLGSHKPVFFLDYDGTLTPIVDRPELAVISEEMKTIVRRLSQVFTVAIISGRMRKDVEKLVGIEGIFYAGSHGFDIRGPGITMVHPQAEKVIPLISELITQLKKEAGNINGVIIEEKKFSVAVHYRLVKEQEVPNIKQTVERLIKKRESLRMMSGKKVFEILPAINWNKGKALRWIMQALDLSWEKSSIVYIGDDTTDEDAFRTVRTRGTGILVAKEPKVSAANFQVSSPEEIKKLFELLLEKV